MKKILVLSIFPAPYRVEVFRHLAAKYELTIFFETISNDGRNSEWFVKSGEFQFYTLTTPEAWKAYNKTIKKLKDFDCVLAYDYSTITALKLQMRCMLQRVPYYINCDGAFIQDRFPQALVKRFFISHAKGCFAGGENAKAYFRHYGAKDKNIFLHRFTSLSDADILGRPLEKSEKLVIREALGMRGKTVTVCVSNFIPRKRVEVLLEAWIKMPKEHELYIVGGGMLKSEYEIFIRTHKMEHVYLVDYKPKEELFAYFKAADVFAFPTGEDIWGLVINEAMACGLPVVTTDRCVAGLELVENGENGFLVPAGDSELLHKRVCEILKLEQHPYQRMCQNSLNKIRNATLERIAQAHMTAIGE